MEFLDHSSKTSAGQVEEVEASMEGGSFLLRFALVNRVVPCFPGNGQCRSKRGLFLNLRLLPLYYRPQFRRSESVIHNFTNGRHGGDSNRRMLSLFEESFSLPCKLTH